MFIICIFSSNTAERLDGSYAIQERGKITVKGKGEMVTFFVNSKSGRNPPTREDVSVVCYYWVNVYTKRWM